VTFPIVARIRDVALRDDYARRLAGWLDLPEGQVLRGVRSAGSAGAGGGTGQGGGGAGQGGGGAGAGRDKRAGSGQGEPGRTASVGYRFDPRDPVARVEREALECMIQAPQLVPAADADGLGDTAFEVPAHRAVHQAVRAAGGIATAVTMTTAAWTAAVQEHAPDAVAGLVSELAVAPLPADTQEALERYALSVVLRVAEVEVTREIGTLRSRVQRMDVEDPGQQQAFAELMHAEGRRRALRDRFLGA
jgi:DNA primase